MGFRKTTLTGERFSGGSRVDGSWVNGTTAPLSVKCSLQPINGKEMENTPSLRRQKGSVFKIYTDTELFTVKSAEQADNLFIGSDRYEVLEAIIWSNNVRNHRKYFISELISK